AQKNELLNDTLDGGDGTDEIVNENANQALQLGGFNDGVSVYNFEKLTGAAGGNGNGVKISGTGGNNTFDFCGVTVTNVTLVNLGNGHDSVVTDADATATIEYRGGNHTDTITLNLTPAQWASLSAADIAAVEAYVADPTDAGAVAGLNAALGPVGINVDDTFETVTLSAEVNGTCIDITDCFGKNVVAGTNGADVIDIASSSGVIGNMTSGDDLAFGLDGDDVIHTEDGGADCVFAGDGDDTIIVNGGSALDDHIDGGAGSDTITSSATSQNITLGNVNAGLSGGGNAENIEAIQGVGKFNNGARTLSGTDDDNTFDLSGGSIDNIRRINMKDGDDTLDLTGASVTGFDDVVSQIEINLGGGSDTFLGSDADEKISGESGNNADAGESNTIDAAGGNDIVITSGGADDIDAGTGNDTVLARADHLLNDTQVEGGDGNDVLANSSTSAALQVADINAGTGPGAVSGFEEIVGKGKFNNGGLNLNGTADANTFDLEGIDLDNWKRVNLLSGDDVVTTADAHGTLRTQYDGGAQDTEDHITLNLTLAEFTAIVTNPAQAAALDDYLSDPTGKTLDIAALDFTAKGFESASLLVDGLPIAADCFVGKNVVIGTNSGDTIPSNGLPGAIGNVTNGDDLVLGLDGNDDITAGGGDDCLFGMDGNDRFFATGQDALYDVIHGGDEAGGLGDELINTGGSLQLFGFNDGVHVSGIEVYRGNGKALKGTNGSNLFDFSAVNVENNSVPVIELKNGDDTVIGGGVDDLTYDLGNGDDTFTGTAAR
ncbi:beta strand repeat-containing protein, partial [Pseudoponticoccus marisrubri]|uniref:beta strand repeat-containing protein n=1 Tax=Pseudoponticoccus marisrubri TaxID=1685382 RepID=UPI00346211EE